MGAIDYLHNRIAVRRLANAMARHHVAHCDGTCGNGKVFDNHHAAFWIPLVDNLDRYGVSLKQAGQGEDWLGRGNDLSPPGVPCEPLEIPVRRRGARIRAARKLRNMHLDICPDSNCHVFCDESTTIYWYRRLTPPQ